MLSSVSDERFGSDPLISFEKCYSCCQDQNLFYTPLLYISFTKCAIAKNKVRKLEIEVLSLGKSVLPQATFLLHGIKVPHILHLRNYRHSSINNIVVLVYEIYSFFKDSAFTAVIGMQI